jgi:alkylated DNA repair dioxygenase AlkB
VQTILVGIPIMRNPWSPPVIASISLGAGRKFQLRKKGKGTTIHSYWLEHGSLLLMQPGCQLEYIHQLPKSSISLPRINFTFRPYCKVS